MTNISDEDITAFRVPPSPQPAPVRRRRLWPWLLAGFFVALLILGALGACIVSNINDFAGNDVTVSVDGDTWRVGTVHGVHGWVAAMAATAAVAVVLIVVPLVVMFALLAAALGIGAALFAVLLAAALAASPLLLLGVLIWWIVRPRRRAPSAAG